jgi:WD40 repeat protein
LRVYDIATGKELYNQEHKGWITHCVTFAPDGKSVITGHEKSSKGVAKVWSVTK